MWFLINFNFHKYSLLLIHSEANQYHINTVPTLDSFYTIVCAVLNIHSHVTLTSVNSHSDKSTIGSGDSLAYFWTNRKIISIN